MADSSDDDDDERDGSAGDNDGGGGAAGGVRGNTYVGEGEVAEAFAALFRHHKLVHGLFDHYAALTSMVTRWIRAQTRQGPRLTQTHFTCFTRRCWRGRPGFC